MGSISVSNLGKAYKKYPTPWSRLLEWFDPRGLPRHQLHWVLKEVDFSIRAGEAVGIVGVNGAGKSTLLKMITGTNQPTTGTVQLVGRVAALLELGMGFHPDFTGRQNALMAGQLLGMHADELNSLMPEIEAFAGISDYIDQPVRVYSSGMQVRLAFAVATCKRPDILIVDEALSVGDAAFQRKCLQRIEDFRTNGTTLLLVSHDIETIKKICNRALFIKEGSLFKFGEAKQVCDEYEQYLFGGQAKYSADEAANSPKKIEPSSFDPELTAFCERIYGNGMAEIVDCWLSDLEGRRINVVASGEPFRWCYRVLFNEYVEYPKFAMMIKTLEGVSLFGSDTKQIEGSMHKYKANDAIQIEFTLQNPLAPGIYYLNCGVRVDTSEGAQFLSRRVDAAMLRVTTGVQTTAAVGVLEMQPKVTMINL